MENLNTTLKMKCPICGKYSSITVPTENYFQYLEGRYVQDAFPQLSISQRELFITGMCEECQDKIFINEDI